jgi:oligopeptide transport system ATP-binding protein
MKMLVENMTEELAMLAVSHLCKYFPAGRSIADMLHHESRVIRAVDDVSFQIQEGKTFGLVGESGCGKTTTSKVILRLHRPTSGNVLFQGRNLHGRVTRSELKYIHRSIQAVFQDPGGSLDPRMTTAKIVEEPLVIHSVSDAGSRTRQVTQVLDAVGLANDQYKSYPHELSGGQKQRVAIARALVLKPKLLVLDEPVSALDMSIRAQILNLLKDLQIRLDLTYLFIAHDLSVMRYMCDFIAVMHQGQIVETCETGALFRNPLHPYTKTLLDAVPVPDPSKRKERQPAVGITPATLPDGCRFRSRCPHAMDMCSEVNPELREVSPGHLVSCHLFGKDDGEC